MPRGFRPGRRRRDAVVARESPEVPIQQWPRSNRSGGKVTLAKSDLGSLEWVC